MTMRRNELNQIFSLNKEVKMWQKELERSQCKLLTGRETEEIRKEIKDSEKIIEGKLIEIQIMRKRVLEYISLLDDSLMRQILFYRHISCMQWWEVAKSIGISTSENSLKQRHSRFLRHSKQGI